MTRCKLDLVQRSAQSRLAMELGEKEGASSLHCCTPASQLNTVVLSCVTWPQHARLDSVDHLCRHPETHQLMSTTSVATM